MRMNNEYAQALDALSDHIERYGDDIMSYLGALMLADEMNEPDSTFNHIRNCEEHRRIIDERDALNRRVRLLRVASLDKKDHPMYSDPEKKKEPWHILLDERNFDRSGADTLEKKLAMQKNYTLLDQHELMEREDRMKDERKVIEAVMATLTAQPDREREIIENVRKMGYGI